MNIQNKLTDHLKKEGYKISTIATVCNIDEQRAYRLFNGTSKMTADEFFRICEMYDIEWGNLDA